MQSQQHKDDVEALCENTAYNIIHLFLSQARKRSGLLKMSSFIPPSPHAPPNSQFSLFFFWQKLQKFLAEELF